MGRLYYLAAGVPQNLAETVKWWSLAARQGDATAQFNLGLLYHNGFGVPKNHDQAARWWTLVSAQGMEKAQLNLGHIYRGHGILPPPDRDTFLRKGLYIACDVSELGKLVRFENVALPRHIFLRP